MPAVAELAAECFARPWSENAVRDAVKSPQASVLAAFRETGLAGYAIFFYAGGEGEIESIAVREKDRRLGVGNALLSLLFAEARRQQACRIFLEVRESNESAIRFYEKNGFASVGVRKGFYEGPIEDAVLMRKEL